MGPIDDFPPPGRLRTQSNVVQHPDRRLLSAFLTERAELDEPTAEYVFLHLLVCHDCRGSAGALAPLA